MKNYLLLVGFLLTLFPVKSQVTSIPEFVQEGTPIEIIFDATQGTGGLKDYTGDVYAHTGVITNKSTSSSDWKYVKAAWNVNRPDCKMLSLGNNRWKLSITPDIRAFYGITDPTEIVQQLAFVFRNADGSKEGKATGGKDIFVKVYPQGLVLKIEKPAEKSSILSKGTVQDFIISASAPTTLRCLINGTEVSSATNATELTFQYTFNTPGNYEIVAEAQLASSWIRDTAQIIVRPDVVQEIRPAGIRPGINIIDDASVTLCLYAPGKQFVYLLGDFNDWKIDNNYLLKKDGDYWWLNVQGLEPGKEYAFQYGVDGTLKIADPYTDKVLDPWNDPYIPASVYPDLKPYPTGKTTGIVSVFQTRQESYNWKVADFQAPAKDKLVIYELLVRDFTEQHSFQAVMEKLDYLKNLGVQAIELMPVNEFEGNDSWGYNPSFYFAVDKYYGRKNDFKALVDACHQKGMAVIIDMVLNHSYGQSPFVQLYWDETNNRPSIQNPWYNTVSPNPVYNWGYDFNHTSPQTQALVDSVCSYWMSRYKIDGFRFDFTKGFTQTPGDGNSYDASRISILKRMTSEIYKRKPNAIVIFEHLAPNNEEVELADAGILLWGNMNYNYTQAIVSNTGSSASDLTWSLYTERGFHQPNLVSYMESHDEERLMYQALTQGRSSGSYNVKDPATALDRAGLNALFYLLLPGPKMIWQFGELGYDYSINTCTNGSIDNNCRLASKPVRWDYFADPVRKNLYKKYSDLAYLKQNYPVFSSGTTTYSLKNTVKYFIWKSSGINAFSVGNFGLADNYASFEIPKTGTWYELFSGKAVDFTSVNFQELIKPGEYRLYTDQKINIPTSVPPVPDQKVKLTVYPNPVENELTVGYAGKSPGSVNISDLRGNTVYRMTLPQHSPVVIPVSGLSQGMYLLQIRTNDTIQTVKFLKK